MPRQPTAAEREYTPIIAIRSGNFVVQTVRDNKGTCGEIIFPVNPDGARELGELLANCWQNWFWSISVDYPRENGAPFDRWRSIISDAVRQTRRERIDRILGVGYPLQSRRHKM